MTDLEDSPRHFTNERKALHLLVELRYSTVYE